MRVFTGEGLPASQAARLTGLSVRTVKRLCSSGQLESFKSPGGHWFVLRASLEKFLRDASPAPAPASSVLQNKREGVQLLTAEIEERKLRRELSKLDGEEAKTERDRAEAARTQRLATRARLKEIRLQQDRNAQDREQERRKQEREQWRRRWIQGAANTFPDWLSVEQEQVVRAAVEAELGSWDTGNSEDAVGLALERTIERVVSPWRAEREERARREQLIENTIGGSAFWTGTADEKARAAAEARAALSQMPLGVGQGELQAVVAKAVAPVRQAIEERQTRARREQLIAAAGRWLPWDATEGDKVQATAAVRSALTDVPLGASQAEEQAVVAAALASIRQGIEERTAARQQQEERERKKSTLITFAVFHASNYLDQENSDGNIELAPGDDFGDVRRDVEAAVRSALEEELVGNESQNEANRIAREVVDEALDGEE